MQPVHAQTDHSNTDSHSDMQTSTVLAENHGVDSNSQVTTMETHENQAQTTDTSNAASTTASSNDGLMSPGHNATEGHSPAAPGTVHEDTPLKTESHSTESLTTEHSGGEHAAGGDHHTGYHPPAPYVVNVGPATVHANTLIATYVVFAILIGMAFAASRKLVRKPGKKQVFFESLVDLAHGIVKTQISHNTYKFVPLIGSIFLFILVSNWIGLLPWRTLELFGTPVGFEMASPTNDLNTNGALALITVASYWFFGIQKNGLAHFKHYFKPLPFMFPLNAMEDLSRPLSLSFRLFGNVLGGEIVIGILLFLTAPFVITSLVILPMMTLEVLVGFIQAFIFSILTASYIGGMVAEHH